jgi:hypothetical protein
MGVEFSDSPPGCNEEVKARELETSRNVESTNRAAEKVKTFVKAGAGTGE